MPNHKGLVPQPILFLRLAVLALCALGAGACGPSESASTYTIEFSLSDSPEDLALLSLRVAYTSGEFLGNGLAVDCTLLNDDDDETVVFNDDDTSKLNVSIDATDNPLSPAQEIFTCEFLADTQPTAANFTITVLSAEDDFGDPVVPGDIDIVVTSTDLSVASAASTGEIIE